MIAFSRYAIVAIFVVAGVLTPPDAITQLLMAGPLLILYGLSIVVVKITETRRIRSPVSENLAEAPIKS
jgi:sec-independent protein translocase protein TatC